MLVEVCYNLSAYTKMTSNLQLEINKIIGRFNQRQGEALPIVCLISLERFLQNIAHECVVTNFSSLYQFKC